MNKLNNASDLGTGVSIIAVVISIISAVVSGVAYHQSDKQFWILNQGYLDGKLDFVVYNPGAVQANYVITDSSMILGLKMNVTMENVGNLPLKYDVVDVRVVIDGIAQAKIIDDSTLREGMLYPKQSTNFFTKSIYFNSDKKAISLNEIKTKKITCDIAINYGGFTQATGRSFYRTYELLFNRLSIQYKLVKINDQLE